MENGKMVYRGLLSGSISYHGHRLDQLRTWFIRAISTGDSSSALACVVELDLFSRCEGESIRTNMMNRLTIFISERLTISSDTLVQLGDYMRIWEATRRDEDASISQTALVQLIHLMYLMYPTQTQTPTTQTPQIQDMRTLYYEGPRQNQITSKEAKAFYEDFQLGIGWSCPEEDRWEAVHDRDPPEVREVMNNFIYWFTFNNPKCLYPMYRLTELGNAKLRVHPRFRGWSPSTLATTASSYPLGGRSRPEYVVWEYLLQDGTVTPVLETLFEWYTQRSGSWEVMTHAVLSCINEDPPNSSEVTPQTPKIEDPLEMYNRNLKGEVNWDTIRMLKGCEARTSDDPLIRQIRQHQKKPTRKTKRAKQSSLPDCGYVDLSNELTEDPHPL